MRPGGGQSKGASYERFVAKTLSNWCQPGRDDLFWRTAGSGSRGTKLGAANQLGDIGALGAGGHELLEYCIIECKCYRALDWPAFIFDHKGALDKFWLDLRLQCSKHKRLPILIAKENRRPSIVMTYVGILNARPILEIDRMQRLTDRRLAVVTLTEFVSQSYPDFVRVARAVAEDIYAPVVDQRSAPNPTPRTRLQIRVPRVDS